MFCDQEIAAFILSVFNLKKKRKEKKVSHQIPQNEKQYFHNVMYYRCSFEKHISHICEKKILSLFKN